MTVPTRGGRQLRLPPPLRFIANVIRRARSDVVVGRAAETSFFALLSLPATFVAVIGGMGFLASALGRESTDRIRDRVVDFASIFFTAKTVDDFLEPAIDALISRSSAGLLGFGILIALWSASRATKILMEAVRSAYDQEETRGFLRRRLIALAVTFVGMIAAVLVLPLLVAGPRVGAAIGAPFGLEDQFRIAWRLLYWPVAGMVGIALLTTFYNASIPGKQPWLRQLPGAATAVALWLLAGAALRFYASLIPRTAAPYATLAAPVVLLLWLEVTALAVMLGAELNAEAKAVTGPKSEVSRSSNTADVPLVTTTHI